MSTWLTSMQGSSNSQSITLFTDANYSYYYDVDWDNDGVFEDTNVRGNITHQYPTSGRYTIRIKGNFPRIYFGDSTHSSAWQTDRKKLLFIDQWGTHAWENLAHAFNGCEFMSVRATDVPNLDSVKNISYLFANINGTFNPSISHWDVSQVTNLEGVFKNAVTFNESIGAWQVDSVKTMESLFEGATAFNQPIGNWSVDIVKNMKNLFEGAIVFNQPIGNWKVDSVKSMESMFKGAVAFDQAIGNWNIDSVKSMKSMFWQANSFNQPIGNWNVSNVTNMYGIFNGAFSFNQPIGNWDVSNVTNMGRMFVWTIVFNQPIGNWDVSNVTNMYSMFTVATSFNQAIENWDLSNVIDMSVMFKGATSFNQSIGNWDVSNVENMRDIFANATSFDQNLEDWNISSLNRAWNMFDSSGMSTANYDSTLIGWQTKPHPINLTVGAANLSYCASDSVRNLLITNSGWSFVGDTFDCVTVGIEQKPNTESSFKVYPNPTQGQLIIESTVENMNIPLFIYNTQGQRVKSIRINKQNQLIELDELPAGLYLMVQGESRQKIVLEK